MERFTNLDSNIGSYSYGIGCRSGPIYSELRNPSMSQLIALTGPAGSGKTTLAKELSLRRHFIRKPFAGNLKAMLSTFLQNQDIDSITIDRMLHGDLKEKPTVYFNGHTPRYAMQTLGTEWRNLIHKELWVDAWERDIRAFWKRSNYGVVVDDLRFRHEADRVRALGGKVVLIARDGFEINFSHPSESEFAFVQPDFLIHNTGDPHRMLYRLTAAIPECNDGETEHRKCQEYLEENGPCERLA